MAPTYAGAGVDIAAGDSAVARIGALVASTARPEVLGGIGGFGGSFAFDPARFRQPVLVSSTDGVGTKSYVASAAARYDTIGIDLVAMCVDDIVCVGAEPLFLLDYITTGKLDPDQMEQLVSGVAAGCRAAGAALLGGEMAEHPGALPPGEFDLAGFTVGVVERDAMLGPDRVAVGDVLVGLVSPGLRCNGYTLARHVLLERAGLGLEDPAWAGASHTLADELLKPSVVYAPAVRAALAAPGSHATLGGTVHAAAHITGGGIPGNLERVLPRRHRRRGGPGRVGRAQGVRRDPPARRRRRGRDGTRVQPRDRHGARRRRGAIKRRRRRPERRRVPGGGDGPRHRRQRPCPHGRWRVTRRGAAPPHPRALRQDR